VPLIGVDARSHKHIQAAIKFALKYNLPLVIKVLGINYILFIYLAITVLNIISIALIFLVEAPQKDLDAQHEEHD
jgi:hypothetical protein